ncbi:peptidase M14 [Marinobacterium nitratireducens]|uniref:Peptidase M14 n=1 Tax=Marinobacterium nitratireducens TaxID=518897 RepID=A0A918DPT9_9GAMM|nr:DUF2817 domain-containing protein [Marinobacterium nitratireducens]GGO76131.1 peptidase M14 [Marinobacterium nitratireducens]
MMESLLATARRPARRNEPLTTYYRRHLPELHRLERLIRKGASRLDTTVIAEIRDGDLALPLYALTLGNPASDAPVLMLSGGIHGVERIGTQLLLAQLRNLLSRLEWDQGLQQDLAHIRLVLCPLVNPVGMAHGWRSNGNGVDLMRNAPIDAEAPSAWPLSGHRVGSWLPWYRGARDSAMQPESQALCDLVTAQIADAPFTLALDCHSGFGMRDRIWFPYAGSQRMLEHAAEVHALTRLFERAQPHHPYVIEPQFHQYRTHGDLWDYLYAQQRERQGGIFLPLTLEMGSWLWVKKNLRQLTSFKGLFNPLVPHRHKRILRRHSLLFDFLIRATRSWQSWLPDEDSRARHQRQAVRRWARPERS